MNFKVLIVSILVVQTTALVLLLKLAGSYNISIAILLSECSKLIISLLIHFIQTPDMNLKNLYSSLFGQDSSFTSVIVLALLYFAQNNLLFFAIAHLDAATYQVTAQLKILTTALFSALMLNRRFSTMQWLSLILLTVGMVLIQLPSFSSASSNSLNGFLAVIAACISSGFAGVWFEKMLKETKVSLWIRNIQLSLFSIIPALVLSFSTSSLDGLFNLNKRVLAIIFMQSVGGLLVSYVIKYTDNIIKSFAGSISIILTCICSVYFFDFKITSIFLTGFLLVILASTMYAYFWNADSKDIETLSNQISNPIKKEQFHIFSHVRLSYLSIIVIALITLFGYINLAARKSFEPEINFNPNEATSVATENKVLIGIFSVESDLGKRELLRSIYKQFNRTFPTVDIKFIVGKPSSKNFKQYLEMENQIHQDLVILDIKKNMNEMKTFYYFKHIYELGKKYKMVVKSVSDCFLHLPRLEAKFRNLPKNSTFNFGKNGWYGTELKYLLGEFYGFSWDLVQYVATTSDSGVREHIFGLDDVTSGRWIQSYERHKSVEWVGLNAGNQYVDIACECVFSLAEDTMIVHALKKESDLHDTARHFIPGYVNADL